WTLAQPRHLKREPEGFVTQIPAAPMLGRDPDRNGCDFADLEPLAVDRITVPPSTDLQRLATNAELPHEPGSAPNPTLVRGETHPGGSWTLRIPEGERDRVVAALAPRRPSGMVGSVRTEVTRVSGSGDIHVVRPRDTVSGIAHRYGVSVDDVMRWNRLD